MNKYKFLDTWFDWFFNQAYAIEPEISRDFLNRKVSNIYTGTYSESNTIKELTGLHKADRKVVKKVSDMIQEFYKDKFPLGSDGKLSWWVHFHIFKWNYQNVNYPALKLKLLNCPLYCKIRWKKLYSRAIARRAWFRWTTYWNNSKSSAVTHKNSYHTHTSRSIDYWTTSIEFRCNNVFDYRLYWYYVWVLIAAWEWVKFKKTSDLLRTYVRRWNIIQYREADVPVTWIAWCRMWEENYKAIRHNIKIILKLLQENEMINAATDLLSYVNEYWFEIKMKIRYQDSFSWEMINGWFEIKKMDLMTWVELTNLHFQNSKNFYLFIEKEIVKRVNDLWIPNTVTTVSLKEIEEVYKKEVPDHIGKVNTIWQTTLFINQEETCQSL